MAAVLIRVVSVLVSGSVAAAGDELQGEGISLAWLDGHLCVAVPGAGGSSGRSCCCCGISGGKTLRCLYLSN